MQAWEAHVDSIGTYSRYNYIYGLALLYPDASVTTNEVALYIADYGNNKLKVLNLKTLVTSTVDTSDDPYWSYTGIAIYQYNLFATGAGVVVKYTIDSTSFSLSSRIIYSGRVNWLGGIDGATFTSATYGYPNYIAHDGAGNLYVGDHFYSNYYNGIDSIRLLSAKSGNVTTLAGKTG